MPDMKVMTIAEAQAAFDKVLESLVEDSVVLKRGDNDVAAVISIEEFLAFCERVGRQAAARGLSEEKLAELLRNDD